MGFKTLPECAVPQCEAKAMIAWPGIGWICGPCCVKVDKEHKRILAEEHKRNYARLVGAAQSD